MKNKNHLCFSQLNIADTIRGLKKAYGIGELFFLSLRFITLKCDYYETVLSIVNDFNRWDNIGLHSKRENCFNENYTRRYQDKII